jgi:hypothetical protein
MFDLDHSQSRQHPVPARLLGIQFVANSGARLILAASRIGGDEGAALACACRDMILDRDTDPLHWPIEELTDLLKSPTQRRDGQVEHLIRRLDHLRQEIDRVGDDQAAVADSASRTGPTSPRPIARRGQASSPRRSEANLSGERKSQVGGHL